ncbi:DUF2294 domain-containing protein [Anaerobacillus sp. MEB173]|uniref:DUF2294 domain-containing protein n=1 Tax=Anaerobacillus sp. MEB173 TaxID=3383345 RepID=UPI003F9099C4
MMTITNATLKKGLLEAEISKKLTQWEKEYLGRGPTHVKTTIVDQMVIVNLKGILSPAEKKLVNSSHQGMISVKQNRNELVESGKEYLKGIIKELTGEDVVSFHTDVSTRSGERIIIFILSENLGKKLIG